MSDNHSEFLISVHRKIRKKKQHRSLISTVSYMVLAGVISFQSAVQIQNERLDKLWAELSSETAVYDWELINDISEDEAMEYLIDEMDFIELLDLLQNQNNNVNLIQELKLENQS